MLWYPCIGRLRAHCPRKCAGILSDARTHGGNLPKAYHLQKMVKGNKLQYSIPVDDSP